MRNFLKEHEEWVVVTIALLAAAVLIVIFTWNMTFLARSLAEALDVPPGTGDNARFNFEEARALDLRGYSE